MATEDLLRSLISRLPKAELHSHLSGSIRDATLRELLDLLPGTAESPLRKVLDDAKKTRSLHDSFEIFSVIHQTVTTSALVQRVVREMIEDNERDGVSYLEMRTTPRSLTDFVFKEGESSTRVISPVKDECVELAQKGDEDTSVDASLNHYVETVACAIAEATVDKKIQVRLILSVNRTSSLANIERIIKLAVAWRRHSVLVVGLDVSGDPTKGRMAPILELLQREASSLLKICIHAGETMNVAETEAVLDFKPQRLGHCCVLSESSRRRMLESRIPLELCPTSNTLTLHLPDFSFHPQTQCWLQNGYPLAVCTDDSGVFNVTLTDELVLVSKTHNLTLRQAASLACCAFDFAFCDDGTRQELAANARQRAEALLRELERDYLSFCAIA
jgi:adenosine deaminase